MAPALQVDSLLLSSKIDCLLFLQQKQSKTTKKMSLFGISGQLEFGVCNHSEPLVSPYTAREGELFHRGKRKLGLLY